MGRIRNRPRRQARRESQVDPRIRVLVVSEGEVTEREYLDGFKLFARNELVDVHHPRQHGAPRTVVEIAKRLQQRANAAAKAMRDDNLRYDEVWVMYDIDRHPDPNGTRQMALDNGFKLAISNPCFELWILIHFRSPPGARAHTEYVNFIREYLPGYCDDNKHVDFNALRDGYEMAVRRAQSMERVACDGGLSVFGWSQHNPMTGVYLLTERILNAGSGNA